MLFQNKGIPLQPQLRTRFWAFSSAGSEHLPYKQRVGGSNPSTPTTRFLVLICSLFGRLAQLVQSICLTSRGSAVRIRQRPPNERGYPELKNLSSLFLCIICLVIAVCYFCISEEYSSVDRYRSPESGNNTTMFFPSYWACLPNCMAA